MNSESLTSSCKQFGPPMLLIVSKWDDVKGYRTAFQAYVDSYIDISEYPAGQQLGTTNLRIRKGRMTGLIAGPNRLHVFIDADSEFTVSPYAPSLCNCEARPSSVDASLVGGAA